MALSMATGKVSWLQPKRTAASWESSARSPVGGSYPILGGELERNTETVISVNRA